MTILDRNIIADTVRLLEQRTISDADADRLCGEYKSRDVFLRELCVTRGFLARHPDVAAAIGRVRSTSRLQRDDARSRRGFYESAFAQLDPGEPVAVYVPRWRGVAAATRCLYRQSIPIPATRNKHPEDIDAAEIAVYADFLLASGCRHFVISGGDNFHLELIHQVLGKDPDIRFDLVWHSNYLQMGEEADWRQLRRWVHAAQNGAITRFGVIKAGLDEFLRKLDIDSVLLRLFLPMRRVEPRRGEIPNAVGIWLSGSSSYRKLPHAMIAAVKAMPTFYLKGAGIGPEGMALVTALDVPFLQVLQDPIPYTRMLNEIAKTKVSLYVTISECSPMLPVESFSVGVPCLIGPSSDLFRDDRLLREMLVVEEPYNPGLIAEKATAVVQRTDEILSAYRKYNQSVEIRAREALARFLA